MFSHNQLCRSRQLPSFSPTHIEEDIDLTIQDVMDSIQVSNVSNASGSDSVNRFVLREVASCIASLLTYLGLPGSGK